MATHIPLGTFSHAVHCVEVEGVGIPYSVRARLLYHFFQLRTALEVLTIAVDTEAMPDPTTTHAWELKRATGWDKDVIQKASAKKAHPRQTRALGGACNTLAGVNRERSCLHHHILDTAENSGS